MFEIGVETLLHQAARVVLLHEHLLQAINILPKDVNYMLLNSVTLIENHQVALKLLIRCWPYPVLVFNMYEKYLDVLVSLVKDGEFGSIQTIELTGMSPFSALGSKYVPHYISEPEHIGKLIALSKHGGNVVKFFDDDFQGLDGSPLKDSQKDLGKCVPVVKDCPLSIFFDLSLEWSMEVNDIVEWINLYLLQQKLVMAASTSRVPLKVLLHLRSLRMVRFEHNAVLSLLRALDPQYLKCLECYNSSFLARDSTVSSLYQELSAFVHLEFLSLPYIPKSFKTSSEIVKCLGQLTNLRGIQVCDSDMNLVVLEQIFRAGIKSSHLDLLKLVRVRLDRSVMNALNDSQCFAHLSMLFLNSLKDMPKYVTELTCFLAKQTGTLSELHLMYCGFSNLQLGAVATALCRLQALRILKINETENLNMSSDLRPVLNPLLRAGVNASLNDIFLEAETF